MHEENNVIHYPDAADWHALAARVGNNPRALRHALGRAAQEIALLRLECVRAGVTPPKRWSPEGIHAEWPEVAPKAGVKLKFTRSSDAGPSV